MLPTSPKARKIRERLNARRSELLGRYKDTLDRADEELGARAVELIDVANDQWDARVLGVMSETDALALENIVAALNRLDHGAYGVCTACEDRITPARLEVLPEAAECAACARFAEEQRPRFISEVS